MRKHSLLRAGGALTAAFMLLTSLSAVPAMGASLTGKSAASADYSMTIGKTVSREESLELNLADFGMSATETVTEILVDVSIDVSSGLPIMPAYGYSAPGHINDQTGEEDNWYSDGIWMQEPVSECTISFAVSEEYTIPGSFQLQVWGEDEKTIGSYNVNSVGIVTGGGASIGVASRKGDVNDDKTVDAADAAALANYLTAKETTLGKAANADLDKNNKLNAVDLTLLKRGLMDGSFNTSADTGETAMEFVNHIKLGWNLGNTLDSTINEQWKTYSDPYSAETAWGCPFTTKAMIDTVKAAGFNTVRVPVTWGQKTSGAPDYTIDSAWMDRVQEVVDYAYENGMYVILNIHHDNEPDSIAKKAGFYPDEAHKESSNAFIKSVWTQVATRFESYDSHLIFETLNEPRLVGTNYEWNGGTSEARAIVNEYNATALSAIRATGGNNEKRFVMMPGYAASPDAAVINDLKLPDDDHLIVSIHAYTPYDFALNKNGTSEWNESDGTWDIVQNFERVRAKFLSNGIPVIVGEFGALNKNNESTRAKWAEYYTKTASSYGIPCVWWDNNQFTSSGENFGLIDRNSNTVAYPEIMAALVRGTEGRG